MEVRKAKALTREQALDLLADLNMFGGWAGRRASLLFLPRDGWWVGRALRLLSFSVHGWMAARVCCLGTAGKQDGLQCISARTAACWQGHRRWLRALLRPARLAAAA